MDFKTIFGVNISSFIYDLNVSGYTSRDNGHEKIVIYHSLKIAKLLPETNDKNILFARELARNRKTFFIPDNKGNIVKYVHFSNRAKRS